MHTLNWVDILMVAILALIVNAARKSDLITEAVMLFGVIFTACLSLHYYVDLAKVLRRHFVLADGSYEAAAFVLLAGLLLALTFLLKGGWLVILKINIKREIDNWGSLIVAFIKGVFLCSLLLFALTISGEANLEETARTSFSFILFHKPILWAYSVFYAAFISPFFKDESINEKAFRALKEVYK